MRVHQTLGILTGLVWLAAIAAGQQPSSVQACGRHCGVERWAVKTLSDSDRNIVDFVPVRTTIESLVALPRPERLPTSGRILPTEATVFRVEARLLGLRTEADGDYHMVLASPADTTVTLIAEVPDPSCSGSCASGYAEVFAKARSGLLAYVDAAAAAARPLIRVTGVGFFDFPHGQRGVAPNAIELHPVLSVEFPGP